MITEVRQYRQYTVKLEGSGYLALRSHRDLRAVKGTSLAAPLTQQRWRAVREETVNLQGGWQIT